MVKIQIAEGYLEVKEGTSFPLNFGVSDVRDLVSRSGTFSKTITLVGNANNHNLLNHYYDINIVEGTFNINTVTECSVIQNGVPIMTNGLFQLLSVNKVQKSDGYEEEIEYEALIKDSQSDFFTKIDNGKLEDLDFTDLNHTFEASAIVASFNNTVTDKYKYVMPYNNTNVFSIKDFKPGIYAKVYWDRIFAQSGYTYEWATLSDQRFDKLIIPYNGDVPQVDYTEYIVTEEREGDTLDFTQPVGTNATQTSLVTNWTEITDNQNLFDPTTGEYEVPFAITGGESIDFQVRIVGDVNLVNATGGNAYIVDMLSSGIVISYVYRPYVQLLKNGVVVWGSGTNYLEYTFTEGTALANGTTTLISIDQVVTINSSNLAPGDLLTLKVGVGVTTNALPSQIRWKDANSTSGTNIQIDTQLDMSAGGVYIDAKVSTNTLSSGALLTMNDFVPREIKQKDFIKSIFTMYNLFVDYDKTKTNNLRLKTRNDYYDQGSERNWTRKLAKDKEQSLQFLPELSAKKLILTYKADDDDPNKIYTKATNEIYGQVEFTFDNEYIKGVDKKEIIFSPTPITKTPFNAYTPMITGASPQTNIRILYDGGEFTCDPYNIYDYLTTGETNVTTYPMLHHFDDPINPTFDIEFALSDYLFYDGYNITNNGLFNNYWRRTINQINTGKMLTAWFDLTESDIQIMKLSDKIRIDNSWWHINKVIDYNCNDRTLTKVELMSVDSDIDLAPFRTKNPGKPLVNQGHAALRRIIDNTNIYNNTIGEGADVIVKGRNNVIQPKVTAVIIGDDANIEEDGMYLEGENVRTPSTTVPTTLVYKAQITQTGVAAPGLTEVTNDFGGSITGVYNVVGGYSIQGFAGQLTGNVEVSFNYNSLQVGEDVIAFVGSSSTVAISTWLAGVQTDGVLAGSNSYITITQYI